MSSTGLPIKKRPHAMMRTPMSRVFGLGSAKAGTEHFVAQRLTAIALIPLVLWFLASLVAHAGAGYEETIAWLRTPLGALPLVLLIGVAFYHMHVGLQVVIEDYLHGEGKKIAALVANKFWAAAAGVACIWAVLKISFAG